MTKYFISIFLILTFCEVVAQNDLVWETKIHKGKNKLDSIVKVDYGRPAVGKIHWIIYKLKRLCELQFYKDEEGIFEKSFIFRGAIKINGKHYFFREILTNVKLTGDSISFCSLKREIFKSFRKAYIDVSEPLFLDEKVIKFTGVIKPENVILNSEYFEPKSMILPLNKDYDVEELWTKYSKGK